MVNWPVDEGGEGWPIEMSGLPVFDRERRFAGFRGFGICRDIGPRWQRWSTGARSRAPPPKPQEPANVLPFRPAPPTEPAAPPAGRGAAAASTSRRPRSARANTPPSRSWRAN